jgi:monoamine oxidase
MDIPREADVIIVGAGAAGIGAARRLVEAGLSVAVLESRDRIGGRAFTDTTATAFPLDLGCEWLHSANRNPMTRIARHNGFTVDRSPAPWDRPTLTASMNADERKAFHRAMGRFNARVSEAAVAKIDGVAAELLAPNCRWNGLIDAYSTYINGVELDRLSVKDGENYEDPDIDWRLVEGYGTLFAQLGARLPVRLNAPVDRVDHSGKRIVVSAGDAMLSAHAVIVTVPTNVLASGRIAFTPDLPRKREAASRLPLGVADKIFLALDNAEEFERDTNVYGATDRVATGNYYLRISGRPLIEGYFGGDLAKEFEKGGLPAFADFALDELCGVMGSAFRRRARPVLATGWSRDPHAMGSYSHATPGHANERAVLAAPVDDRIFFAGEACSLHRFSTAHGAFQTGVKAANAVLAGRMRSIASARQTQSCKASKLRASPLLASAKRDAGRG